MSKKARGGGIFARGMEQKGPMPGPPATIENFIYGGCEVLTQTAALPGDFPQGTSRPASREVNWPTTQIKGQLVGIGGPGEGQLVDRVQIKGSTGPTRPREWGSTGQNSRTRGVNWLGLHQGSTGRKYRDCEERGRGVQVYSTSPAVLEIHPLVGVNWSG
jgi:hypothetical protein